MWYSLHFLSSLPFLRNTGLQALCSFWRVVTRSATRACMSLDIFISNLFVTARLSKFIAIYSSKHMENFINWYWPCWRLNPYSVEALKALLRLDHHRHQLMKDVIEEYRERPGCWSRFGAFIESLKLNADFKYEGSLTCFPILNRMNLWSSGCILIELTHFKLTVASRFMVWARFGQFKTGRFPGRLLCFSTSSHTWPISGRIYG